MEVNKYSNHSSLFFILNLTDMNQMGLYILMLQLLIRVKIISTGNWSPNP